MSHAHDTTLPAGIAAKILSRDALLRERDEARRAGRRVVHCHGCFDLVHPGHIRHLRQARALGDLLLVSLTGDAEMKKGHGRPLIPEELRAENLAALDCVDWVYIEPRPTAADLLEEVRPDVYVKGREYEHNDDPRFRAERQTVERHGGRVVFSSGDVVFSSTALIGAMAQSVDPYHHRLRDLVARPELSGPSLYETIAGFRGRRVLVVGEPILDTYVFCDRPDVAGESPIMTLRPVERRQFDGGAAVIARHAAALGARPILVTALPDSDEGHALRRRLLAEGVEVRAVRSRRPIAEKQRFLVGTQKVMKLDLLEPAGLDAQESDRLVDLAEASAGDAGGCHAAIVADFGLGLLSSHLLIRLTRAVRRRVGVMAGDVSGRRSGLRAMRGMDLLSPSEGELRDAYAVYDEALPAVTWRLLEETGARAAMVTMGLDGLVAFERLPQPDESPATGAWPTRLRSEHVPALSPPGIDPLGCGDALLATATLALASGGSLAAAAFLGSVAGAVQAHRLGNLPVSASDLRHGIARLHAAHLAFAGSDVLGAARPHAPPHAPTAHATAPTPTLLQAS